MFLSVILLGALYLRLVSFTKLDESFTGLPTDRVDFSSLPEGVMTFCSSKIGCVFSERREPLSKKTLAMFFFCAECSLLGPYWTVA